MVPPDVESSFRTLVAAFAGSEPLPAGGAAAVTAIAMGVGLGLKVIAISQPRPELDRSRAALARMLEDLLPEFEADCTAFADLLAALRGPRDDVDRGANVRDAWMRATTAPVSVAVRARVGETLLTGCAEHVKASVRGDLDAAIELVRAGGRIAERNARENAQRLDAATAKELLAPLDQE